MPRAAVFLDRDDTIIANRAVTAGTAHPGDLIDPDLVRLLPRAGAAMQLLAGTGLPLVIVTNQGGIAAGCATHADVEAVHDRLRRLLHPVTLAAIYYNPFRELPAASPGPFNRLHPWRKPGPGMLITAAAELELDLPDSWMIGDGRRDIDAGVNAGLDPARCLRITRSFDLHDAAEHIADALKTSYARRSP